MSVNDNFDVFTRVKSATNSLYAKVFEVPYNFNELLWASTKQFVVRVHSHDSRGTWRFKEYAVGINRTSTTDPTQQSIQIGDLTPMHTGSKLVGVIENGIPTFYVDCAKDAKVGIQVTMCTGMNKNFFKFFDYSTFDVDLSAVTDKAEPVAVFGGSGSTLPISSEVDVVTAVASTVSTLYSKVFEVPFNPAHSFWSHTRQFCVRVHSHDSRGVFRLKEYAVGINKTESDTYIKIGDLTPLQTGSILVGVIEGNSCVFYTNTVKDTKVGIQIMHCQGITKSSFTFYQGSAFDVDLSAVTDKAEPVAVYTLSLPNVPITGNTTNKQIFIGTGASGGWGTYAFGNDAGANAASTNSLFIGNDVGKDSSGNDVTGVGIGAIPAITTAKGVSAFGRQALKVLTTGDYNNAFGNSTMNALTTGERNNAFGFQALYHLVDGNNNIAIGDKAGSSEADGTTNTSSDNCVFIGNNTRSSTDIVQNEIVIGDSAVGKGENTVQLGNTNMVSAFVGNNRLTRVVDVPASPTANGIKGDISGDTDYLYFCYDTNLWIRIPKDDTWT